MGQSFMTCTNCGGGDVQPAAVKSAFWHDDRLVVVEDIPALRCGACGEQFYDDNTVLVLDLLRGQGFAEGQASSRITVPVFSFRNHVPGAGSS